MRNLKRLLAIILLGFALPVLAADEDEAKKEPPSFRTRQEPQIPPREGEAKKESASSRMWQKPQKTPREGEAKKEVPLFRARRVPPRPAEMQMTPYREKKAVREETPIRKPLSALEMGQIRAAGDAHAAAVRAGNRGVVQAQRRAASAAGVRAPAAAQRRTRLYKPQEPTPIEATRPESSSTEGTPPSPPPTVVSAEKRRQLRSGETETTPASPPKAKQE